MDSPNLSMRSAGFTNDTDSCRSSTLLHWNFFLAANYIRVERTIFILMGLITQETILLASIIKKSEKGFDGYLCSVQPE
ncbi:1-phosphatidylinositol 4,5-bisphosphate phosphodiesterase eta-2-like isoform X1 [Labeo rohita]|uniref:1-phosphatidylinositol 4,5-bisphosphate phosphodiesterase eta-2-like isoform X1 n=1 Tax=Labeo rohita TaxID=84645 RepID=A0A498LYL3_LABRO|nr:1-phosphatidylinositol 4,5-bisphosphate phosphodiesterase eta-2-like isoform X1 [Labeo rohita]